MSDEELSTSERRQIFEWVRDQPRGAVLAMKSGLTATVEARDAVGYIRVGVRRGAEVWGYVLYKTTDFD